MILINWMAILAFLFFCLIGIIALFQGKIGLLIFSAILAFFMKIIMSATEDVTKEKIEKKIKALNNGILNSNNVPSHFTARQCNDMGYLAMELSSYEKDLRQSNLSKSELKKISKSLGDIEKKAKAI